MAPVSETEMIILVTNDDGIRAGGLRILADALADLGRIVVVAPEQEQSASSHAITLDKPLRINEYETDRFGVSGTPTDCVLLAVNGILDRRPELIVSGINLGPNMGEDVTYSGTVAAAIEASILGIPSIAISMVSWDSVPLDAAAAVSRYLAGEMLHHDVPGTSLWNVNIPPLPRDELKGIRITRLGSRVYNGDIIKKTDPRGRDYFWIGGGDPGWNAGGDTDFTAVTEGYISVTPLRLDLTDDKAIFDLKKWNLEWDGR
jgi:5'-nucleotidase